MDRPTPPIFAPGVVRFVVSHCNCDRYCGGLLLLIEAADDVRWLHRSAQEPFEHMSVEEVWDVLDAYLARFMDDPY